MLLGGDNIIIKDLGSMLIVLGDLGSPAKKVKKKRLILKNLTLKEKLSFCLIFF